MSRQLLSAFLVIASAALYYLVVSPLYKGTGGPWKPEQTVQSLRSLNSQYEQTLIQADDLIAQAAKLKSEYDQFTPEQRASMEVMLPREIDEIRLLSEIMSIGARNNLPVTGLTASDSSSNVATQGSRVVSFTVSGTYEELKRFMDSLEKSKRIFSIRSVSFSAPERSGANIDAQIQLETYYLK